MRERELGGMWEEKEKRDRMGGEGEGEMMEEDWKRGMRKKYGTLRSWIY